MVIARGLQHTHVLTHSQDYVLAHCINYYIYMSNICIYLHLFTHLILSFSVASTIFLGTHITYRLTNDPLKNSILGLV